LVLALVVAFCFAGVYAKAAVLDPWEVFGMFRSGYFNIEGRILMTIVFVLILCGMLLIERFFCMFLCPMGAVFALLPMLPFTTFTRNKADCIKGCSICEKGCPANISLGEDARSTSECFQCGKCSAKCPKGNIRLGSGKLAGTEIWLAIAKAAALFAICYFIL
jgi:polyferredoxin